MRISLIAAMAGSRRVIGAAGGMPWKMPADMKRFRSLTLGKPIVMGRKTHESIGLVLPGRRNIVLTRDPLFRAGGCDVVHDLPAALAAAGEVEELMVIGGAAIYRLFLPRARTQYLTLIDAEIDGDTFYPEHDAALWREMACERFEADSRHPHPYRFVTLIAD